MTRVRSVLPALRRAMAAFFAANEIDARVALGWSKRTRRDNEAAGGGNRVILVPGEFDPGGGLSAKALRAGRIDRDLPQNYLDQNLRTLAVWHESVTCSVWAVDDDDAQDEERQIEATEQLFEHTIQAIHSAVDPDTSQPIGFANVESFADAYWTLPPVERPFGRELTFGIVLLVPAFDLEGALAFPQPAVSRDPAT